MTKRTEQEIDWSLCTWKGSRRKQHQEFHEISFSRKLEIDEEMNEGVREFQRARAADATSDRPTDPPC